MTEQEPVAPTKSEYFRENGKSYWRMSDGSVEEAHPVRVPLTDTIKRGPEPGVERSPLLPDTGPAIHQQAAEKAEQAAAVLRSGELGSGDKPERLARVLDETAQIERGQQATGEFQLEQRHGDSYQPLDERQ